MGVRGRQGLAIPVDRYREGRDGGGGVDYYFLYLEMGR